ncbi:uncharacterized protein LOC122241542 isoform X1 [Panthera tigris]|uniref:uncharacterized protein LOC122241542 isoform X1 n=1 Tax=Panthera tigris TaxID=9694 RepID=UPI001C6F78FB|nr:uncharacterized protein LOC122241542 isoform X1 [Panthera tigris]
MGATAFRVGLPAPLRATVGGRLPACRTQRVTSPAAPLTARAGAFPAPICASVRQAHTTRASGASQHRQVARPFPCTSSPSRGGRTAWQQESGGLGTQEARGSDPSSASSYVSDLGKWHDHPVPQFIRRTGHQEHRSHVWQEKERKPQALGTALCWILAHIRGVGATTGRAKARRQACLPLNPLSFSLRRSAPRYSLPDFEILSQQEVLVPTCHTAQASWEGDAPTQPRPIRVDSCQTRCYRAGVASVTRNVRLTKPTPGSASHLVPITPPHHTCVVLAREAGGSLGGNAEQGEEARLLLTQWEEQRLWTPVTYCCVILGGWLHLSEHVSSPTQRGCKPTLWGWLVAAVKAPLLRTSNSSHSSSHEHHFVSKDFIPRSCANYYPA